MKFQKIMCSVLALGSLAGCAKYNGTDTNKEDTKIIAKELALHDSIEWGGNTPEEFLSDVIGLITSGGTAALTPVYNYVKTKGCRYALEQLGLEYRSIEERKLDELTTKVDQLEDILVNGLESVKTTIVSEFHKKAMNDFLSTVKKIADPVMDELEVLGDLSYKELLTGYSAVKLEEEKVRFYEKCKSLRFDIGQNDLWYTAKNLAEYIVNISYVDSKIDLFTLYEETYGSNENWTYMMIKPRTQFISYLATVANGLAMLAQLVAAYDISLLPTGDSNIKAITGGVDKMIASVNEMNGYFQKELLKLESIKINHDRKNIMVHRSKTTVNGQLVVTEDDPISSRLMPISNGYNYYNYMSYSHSEGIRRATEQGWMESYIYTLDATKNNEYYEIIIKDYEDYCKASGKTNYQDYTIKDYLLDIGFIFKDEEKELIEQAKGFYQNISLYDEWQHPSMTESYRNHNLGVNYYSFEDRKSRFESYDNLYYENHNSWFHKEEKYTHTYTDTFGDYYLALLDNTSKAFRGDITTTVLEGAYYNLEYDLYSKHFKGSGYWGKIYGNTDYLVKAHLL